MQDRARRDGDDDAHRRAGGPRSVGLAIAGALVTFFAMLPFALVVAVYLFVTIYAIVRAIGPGAGENAVAIVVGFVLVTSALGLTIAGAVFLLGRSITPRKRRTET